MNRKQLRNMTKKIKRRTHCSSEIAKITAYIYGKNAEENHKRSSIKVGDKVKLDVNKITLSKTFPTMNKLYQEFVTSNRDTIFTVAPSDNSKHTSIFTLEEDVSDPKWYFHYKDLIPTEEQ